jgi:hypothetical protein
MGSPLSLVLVRASTPRCSDSSGRHGRFEIEAQVLTLTEAQFALAALARLPVDPQAHALLKKLLRQARPVPVQPMD